MCSQGCTLTQNPIKKKIETIIHIWGEEQSEEEEDKITKLILERERFSVPHA